MSKLARWFGVLVMASSVVAAGCAGGETDEVEEADVAPPASLLEEAGCGAEFFDLGWGSCYGTIQGYADSGPVAACRAAGGISWAEPVYSWGYYCTRCARATPCAD